MIHLFNISRFVEAIPFLIELACFLHYFYCEYLYSNLSSKKKEIQAEEERLSSFIIELL